MGWIRGSNESQGSRDSVTVVARSKRKVERVELQRGEAIVAGAVVVQWVAWMNGRPTRRCRVGFARLVLLMTSLCIAIVIMEVILCLCGIQANPSLTAFYQFHSTLGWDARRSHRAFRSNAQYGHFVYRNPDGLSCTEGTMNQPASRGRPSVAILGDSFVDSYYQPYQYSFPYLLEQSLGVQVLNFGISGYAPEQYLLKARAELGQYCVKALIVLLFAHNDLVGLNRGRYQGYAKPLFEGDSIEPANLPLPRLKGHDAFQGLVRSVLHRSSLYAAFRPAIHRLVLYSPQDLKPRLYARDDMAKALRLIGQMHLEFPKPLFLVMLVPAEFELSDRNIYQANADLFLEACREQKVRGVLPRSFLDYQGDVSDLYIEVDGHFSRLGTELMAGYLHSLLSGFPDDSPVPRANRH